MDPNTALRCLVYAIQDDDPEDIEFHIQNLLEWAGRGGFRPSPDLCKSFHLMHKPSFNITETWRKERVLTMWLLGIDNESTVEQQSNLAK